MEPKLNAFWLASSRDDRGLGRNPKRRCGQSIPRTAVNWMSTR
jgi:hypothetical protein